MRSAGCVFRRRPTAFKKNAVVVNCAPWLMAYNNERNFPSFVPPRKREPPRAPEDFAQPRARRHGCAAGCWRLLASPTSRPPRGRTRTGSGAGIAAGRGRRQTDERRRNPKPKKSRISVRIRPRKKYGENGRNCTAVLCLLPLLVALLLIRLAIRSGQSHPGVYTQPHQHGSG